MIFSGSASTGTLIQRLGEVRSYRVFPDSQVLSRGLGTQHGSLASLQCCKQLDNRIEEFELLASQFTQQVVVLCMHHKDILHHSFTSDFPCSVGDLSCDTSSLLHETDVCLARELSH